MSARSIPFSPPETLGAVDRTLFDLTIDVVTPMFGGGASPGESDPLWPIRGSAIRGHLRFWWRACNAHRYGTAKWKKPQTPSRVGVKFRLVVGLTRQMTSAEIEPLARGVEQALWAWIVFGGVGARTRRGCGNLFGQNDSRLDFNQFRPSSESLEGWLRNKMKIYALVDGATDQAVSNVPRLRRGRFLSGKESGSVVKARFSAIEVMRQLHQGENIGRDPAGPNIEKTSWAGVFDPNLILCATRSI